MLENLDWASVLPQVLENGTALDLFSAERCFSIDVDHPLAPAELGYPTVTSVITVDPQTGAVTDGLCYLEFSDGAYFSSDALYLTQVVTIRPAIVIAPICISSIWATRSLTQAPKG